ncbi:MAG: RidA family protein [Hyphomicrobiales bacterium]|nr:RidA family protein [Hyphomicrobiales bacterium]
METRNLADGGYRFIVGVRQYSAGVRALEGYEIVRVRFHRPVPLAEGFARVESSLSEAGRPLAAFCACELRSPEPFTEAGFSAFNDHYIETLEGWGIVRDGLNPVARSNVCPEIDGPSEPAFHAFCYARPSASPEPTFVIAGSGETLEGKATYRETIVRLGDVSPDGIAEKARFVLSVMEARMAALGLGWADVTGTQIYCVHDFHQIVADMVRRGAAAAGMRWHFCRPPIVDIEYEMDCRGVYSETVA